MQRFSHIAIAIMVLGSSVYFVSCEKESTQSGNTIPSERIGVIMQKTNGGKKAILPVASGFSMNNKTANSVVFPPSAEVFNLSKGEWTAAWWNWALALPPAANHPFNDDPAFDVTMGQSGNVWFLATSFGTVIRNCTIPSGKPLLVGMLNFEASDLEGYGATYSERLATANWFADHIVTSTLFCTIDGVPVDLSPYRDISPEFNFNAPSPWYYGATGGYGTAVSDGYFVMVKALNSGSHTIRYGGAFHFSVAGGDGFDFDASADMTYNIIVQ